MLDVDASIYQICLWWIEVFVPLRATRSTGPFCLLSVTWAVCAKPLYFEKKATWAVKPRQEDGAYSFSRWEWSRLPGILPLCLLNANGKKQLRLSGKRVKNFAKIPRLDSLSFKWRANPRSRRSPRVPSLTLQKRGKKSLAICYPQSKVASFPMTFHSKVAGHGRREDGAWFCGKGAGTEKRKELKLEVARDWERKTCKRMPKEMENMLMVFKKKPGSKHPLEAHKLPALMQAIAVMPVLEPWTGRLKLNQMAKWNANVSLDHGVVFKDFAFLAGQPTMNAWLQLLSSVAQIFRNFLTYANVAWFCWAGTPTVHLYSYCSRGWFLKKSTRCTRRILTSSSRLSGWSLLPFYFCATVFTPSDMPGWQWRDDRFNKARYRNRQKKKSLINYYYV